MPDRLVVRNIGSLVTVARRPVEGAAGPLGVIAGAALVAELGRITWVGPEAALPAALVECAVVVDAMGLCVLPGFVDSHTHPVFAGNRAAEFAARAAGHESYGTLLERGEGGILSSVAATRAASDDELLRCLRARADTFLRYGTTTFEAKSGYGLTTRDEVRSLAAVQRLQADFPGLVVPTFLGAHAVPADYRADPDAYVDLIVSEMLPEVTGLAAFCDAFCDQGAFSVAQTRRIFDAARRLGLDLRIHADELASIGAAQLAAEYHAASADHLIQVTLDGIERLAEAGVVATLLPGTSFCLAHGSHAPARGLLNSGITVALATDCNPGTCFTENMQLIIALACITLRMSVEEAVTAATLGGARALRLEHEVGSLEQGKRADLIVLDARSYLDIPYHFGVNLVRSVIAGGRRVI